MNYVPISSINPIVARMTHALTEHLAANEKVTWLIPGGSAIAVAVEVSQNLISANAPLANLFVTLTDERYGNTDNPDENWHQLIRAGLRLPGATTYRVLQPGIDRERTTKQFDETLRNHLTGSDYRIGFFGIGADGHTAGIKQHAIDMNSDDFAVSYIGTDFERITITPHTISLLDTVYAYAVGDEKVAVLRKLCNENISPAEQPAQVLKTAKSFTLFTDVDILYNKENSL